MSFYEKTLTELGKLELVSLLCQTKLWETGYGGAWWTPTLGKGPVGQPRPQHRTPRDTTAGQVQRALAASASPVTPEPRGAGSCCFPITTPRWGPLTFP